jgi:hypothetical protein
VGVVVILTVDAYSGVEICTPIFQVRLAINVGGKSFLKKIKLKWTHPLIKQHKQELLYGKYLALVGMCMLLRKVSIFIQLRSISKLRFSKINTNSDITPPNNLDMVSFEIFLA